MCENKTTPKCNRTCTSTTVAPPYSSYSINLSALEVKQKIVKQADKWRNLPHSTAFCRNVRSWTESRAIKRKRGWKLNGVSSQFIQNRRLVHFAAEALSSDPARSACCSLPPSWAPAPTGGAQVPSSAPGQSRATSCRQGSTTGRRPAATRYRSWHAPLNQGCVLKTISLTWRGSSFGLRAVWRWLRCSWFFNGWSYTRRTAWPGWTEATWFN